MMKVWVVLAFLAVFIATGALMAARGENVFMNGPLEKGHAFMPGKGKYYCNSCHTPVLGARDPKKCTTCHYTVSKTVGRKVGEVKLPCFYCHLEHSHGLHSLVPRSEKACLPCHQDPDAIHRNVYMPPQVPVKNCLTAKCHADHYHHTHRHPSVEIPFDQIHDVRLPSYDENRCSDCHGDVMEKSDAHMPHMYGLDDAQYQQSLLMWLAPKTETFIHRQHILKMAETCKDCHVVQPPKPGPGVQCRMPVNRDGCCKCHSSPNTPPKMWCGAMAPM